MGATAGAGCGRSMPIAAGLAYIVTIERVPTAASQ